MAGIRSESLSWIEQLEKLQAQVPGRRLVTRADIKKAFNLSNSQITNLLNLRDCFDPKAIEKVRLAAPFILSSRSALALTRLKGRVSDLPGALHAALDLVLSRHLATEQIGNLVEWMAGGKPVGEFDPNAKPLKTAFEPISSNNKASGDKQAPSSPSTSAGDDEALAQKTKSEGIEPGMPQSLGQRIGLAIDLLLGRPPGQKDSAGSQGARKHGSKKGVSTGVKAIKKDGKWAARIFWHWSLKPIHHFLKAVARWAVPSSSPGLTAFLRWVVYGLCQLVFWWALLGGLAGHFAPGLKPWVEYPFRYLVYLVAVDLPAWGMRLAHEHLAWAIFIGVLLGIAIFGALFAHPLRMGLLLALLGAVWFYGRGWGTTAIEPSPVAGLAMGDKPSTAPISGPPIAKENSTAGQTSPSLRKITASSSHVPPVPEELRDRMEDDADYTAEFAVTFYGTHYDKHGRWHDWLEDRVTDDYHDAFFKEFDIPSKWQEINDKQLTLAFEPSGKARLIRWDDTSDDFRVEGVLTTRSDLVYPRKFISKRRAALAISFAHKPDGSVSVYKVRETKPIQ